MKVDDAKYNILVIEDNPGDYVLVEDYLQEYIKNPGLTHVKKFADARSLLIDDNHTFDVILLDLSLPDISRDELILEFGLLNQNAPVIILTGYSDLDFAMKSLSYGMSDYLVKDNINPLVLYKSILYSIERHNFLNSLRNSEKKYSDLFHLSPAPMWVYDLETLKFLDVNYAAINHYGYSRDAFLSMTVKDIRPKEDIPAFEKALAEAKQKGFEFFKETFRHLKKDNTLIDVEVIKNFITFNGRKAVLVLSTDITEKLKQIKAIKEQNKKLKEIAWTQSHIVRAPVARLMGLVDLLKQDGYVKDKETVLNHIHSSASEIDEIIKDIIKKSQSVNNLENDKKDEI